ncbi:hypothetical protein GCM10027294_24890 [Marinactinospora endophytica]
MAFAKGWRNAAPHALAAARGVARRGLSRVAGLLSRPVRRPGVVAQHPGPLGSVRERLRGLDRGPWTPVVGAFTFEDRQRGPRARHRVAGDLAEFAAAELDGRGAIRHGAVLPCGGRSHFNGIFETSV